MPPVASPGGGNTGYLIRAGDSLVLDASGSIDLENLPLSYSWDLNGDGVFGDATGVSPTVTWSQLQALGITPARHPVPGPCPRHRRLCRRQLRRRLGYANLVVLPGLNIVSLTATSGGDVNTPGQLGHRDVLEPDRPGHDHRERPLADAQRRSQPHHRLGPGPAGRRHAQPYQITGLSSLTQAQGQYRLTLDASGVAAADGSGTGSGTATVTWLLDTTVA